MHIAPASPRAHDLQVLIDWSSMLPARLGSGNEDVEKMLDWVRTHPRRGQLHIYLHRPLPTASARRLQNMLQALGCRVTARFGAVTNAAVVH